MGRIDERGAGRAPALAPADRRAALIAAAVPLITERGFDVSTRELADAAGVAQGTIFRVFDCKDDLVLAAARSVFARTDHLDELRGVDPHLPLDRRLVEIVRIWQGVLGRMTAVFHAFRGPTERERLGDPHALVNTDVIAQADAIIAGLLAPDADHLTTSVSDVVQLIAALVMASVHPMQQDGPLTTPERLFAVLLHGVHTADPQT